MLRNPPSERSRGLSNILHAAGRARDAVDSIDVAAAEPMVNGVSVVGEVVLDAPRDHSEAADVAGYFARKEAGAPCIKALAGAPKHFLDGGPYGCSGEAAASPKRNHEVFGGLEVLRAGTQSRPTKDLRKQNPSKHVPRMEGRRREERVGVSRLEADSMADRVTRTVKFEVQKTDGLVAALQVELDVVVELIHEIVEIVKSSLTMVPDAKDVVDVAHPEPRLLRVA